MMYFSKTNLWIVLAAWTAASSDAFTMNMMNGSGNTYGQRAGSFFDDSKPGQVSERQVSKSMYGSENYNSDNTSGNNGGGSSQGSGNYNAPMQGVYSNSGGGGGGGYGGNQNNPYGGGGGGNYGGNQNNYQGGGGGFAENYQGGGHRGGGGGNNGQQFQQRQGVGYNNGGGQGAGGGRQFQERNSGMPFQGGGYGGQGNFPGGPTGNMGQQRSMGGPRNMNGPRNNMGGGPGMGGGQQRMGGPGMGGQRMGGPGMGGGQRMGGPGMGRPGMGGPGMGRRPGMGGPRMDGPEMGRRDMRTMGGPPGDEPFMRGGPRRGPGMPNMGIPRDFDMRGPRDGGFHYDYQDPAFGGGGGFERDRNFMGRPHGNMQQGRGHFSADPGAYEGLTDFGGNYSYNNPNRVRRFGNNDQRTRGVAGDRDFYSPISRQTY